MVCSLPSKSCGAQPPPSLYPLSEINQNVDGVSNSEGVSATPPLSSRIGMRSVGLAQCQGLLALSLMEESEEENGHS